MEDHRIWSLEEEGFGSLENWKLVTLMYVVVEI